MARTIHVNLSDTTVIQSYNPPAWLLDVVRVSNVKVGVLTPANVARFDAINCLPGIVDKANA